MNLLVIYRIVFVIICNFIYIGIYITIYIPIYIILYSLVLYLNKEIIHYTLSMDNDAIIKDMYKNNLLISTF